MRSEIITIKKETFETTTYMSNSSCALATTLKGLGYKVAGVGGSYVRLKGMSHVHHKLNFGDGHLISTTYEEPKTIKVTINWVE